jgi:hypothetical protein
MLREVSSMRRARTSWQAAAGAVHQGAAGVGSACVPDLSVRAELVAARSDGVRGERPGKRYSAGDGGDSSRDSLCPRHARAKSDSTSSTCSSAWCERAHQCQLKPQGASQ